jgi:hypothetical protein
VIASTGTEVLTVSAAADITGKITGRPARHLDMEWLPWLGTFLQTMLDQLVAW